MIKRGFDERAQDFYKEYAPLFAHKQSELNQDLILLESVKTIHDLVSSLNADKYLLNKF